MSSIMQLHYQVNKQVLSVLDTVMWKTNKKVLYNLETNKSLGRLQGPQEKSWQKTCLFKVVK